MPFLRHILRTVSVHTKTSVPVWVFALTTATLLGGCDSLSPPQRGTGGDERGIEPAANSPQDDSSSEPTSKPPPSDEAPIDVATDGFQWKVDESAKLSQSEIEGLDGGPARPVGAVFAPDGSVDEFVANEVVLRPRDEDDLQSFVAKYDGIVLRDGSYASTPDGIPMVDVEPRGWYLIEVDPYASALEDPSSNMGDLEGEFVFSSDAAARLLALVAQERAEGREITPNFLIYDQTVSEHEDGMGGYLNAEDWWWMTDTGLSVGVIRAWDYLKYMGLPPTPPPGESVTWTPTKVAIVDRGFALDTTTGLPLDGNQDYFYYGSSGPIQFDFPNNDNRAGSNEDGWHGQKTFGVCCARPRNLFGTAGTGGPVVRPMLMRTGQTTYSLSDAIFYSAIWGADVITISMGQDCGLVCNYLMDGHDDVQSAVYTAIAFDAVVLAAAGNDGVDISGTDFIPCKLDKVICVGSVDQNGMNVYNYGNGVDIWAPTGVRTTPTPDTAGESGVQAVPMFYGTSCSTPFVAGIVGLMKALDPTLRWDGAQEILQTTSNVSTDAKVSHGYVNAYQAVQQVVANQPPTVTITLPADGAEVSWARRVSILSEVYDPETAGLTFQGEVLYYSDQRAGPICSAPCTFENAPYLGTLGEHIIWAVATDPHGMTAESEPITILVTNQAPLAFITYPPSGQTYFADQLINLRGYGFDPDESISSGSLHWYSDLDGELATGGDEWVSLSQGTHTISLIATDDLEQTGEDSISIVVQAGAGFPTAQIQSPQTNLTFLPGALIEFQALANDPEDGVLSGDSIQWYSNIDGFLGTGEELTATLSGPPTACNPEYVPHTITLEVTDSDGNKATHQVTVLVGVIC